MSTSTLTISPTNSVTITSRVLDYVALTKPRIGLLVLITVGVASYIAAWGQPNPIVLIHTLIGTGLIAASSGAFNQWLEKDTDQLMRRTAVRPLPTGRLSVVQVMVFGIATLIAGIAQLMLLVNLQAAFWGLATWVLYVVLYTPLKRYTSANTAVGAISGAMPIFIGWTATGADLNLRAVAMFTILFLWQFPHFMAIAWMYRDQYARAGFKMLTVVEPTGRRAGVQAVLGAVALLPVSLIPALFAPPPGASLYAAFAFLLGVGQLVCAFLFFAFRTEASARLLLRASLIYLPALWLLLMFIPLL